MARNKTWLRIHAEYVPTLLLANLLKRMPFGGTEHLIQAVLKIILLWMPERRQMMRDHLQICFPEKSPDEREQIANESIRSLARGLTVFTRLPRIANGHLNSWVNCEGTEWVEQALALGKGVLFFTAHYACWEMTATYLMRTFPSSAAVARTLDNPKIDSLVANIRSSGNGRFIPKNAVLREGLKHLRNNGLLGILMDQNFAPGGVFVPFFGRLAATTPIVSILARRTGAQVLPMHGEWDGRRTRVIIGKPFSLSNDSDPDRAIAIDTARMTNEIERWIHRHPESWLWLHNRWKRQPRQGEPIVSESLDVAIHKGSWKESTTEAG